MVGRVLFGLCVVALCAAPAHAQSAWQDPADDDPADAPAPPGAPPPRPVDEPAPPPQSPPPPDEMPAPPPPAGGEPLVVGTSAAAGAFVGAGASLLAAATLIYVAQSGVLPSDAIDPAMWTALGLGLGSPFLAGLLAGWAVNTLALDAGLLGYLHSAVLAALGYAAAVACLALGVLALVAGGAGCNPGGGCGNCSGDPCGGCNGPMKAPEQLTSPVLGAVIGTVAGALLSGGGLWVLVTVDDTSVPDIPPASYVAITAGGTVLGATLGAAIGGFLADPAPGEAKAPPDDDTGPRRASGPMPLPPRVARSQMRF